MSSDSSGTSDHHDLRAEDVVRRPISFKSGAETLAGDLVLPASSGPHPAILTVAGTGPQNRYGDIVLADGTVLPHGRYVDISSRLAQAGIASLYWDKRGVGQSSGGDRAPGDPQVDPDSPRWFRFEPRAPYNRIDAHNHLIDGHSQTAFTGDTNPYGTAFGYRSMAVVAKADIRVVGKALRRSRPGTSVPLMSNIIGGVPIPIGSLIGDDPI